MFPLENLPAIPILEKMGTMAPLRVNTVLILLMLVPKAQGANIRVHALHLPRCCSPFAVRGAKREKERERERERETNASDSASECGVCVLIESSRASTTAEARPTPHFTTTVDPQDIQDTRIVPQDIQNIAAFLDELQFSDDLDLKLSDAVVTEGEPVAHPLARHAL